MAVQRYRSFWTLEADGTDLTPETQGFTPPDVARAIISIQSGKRYNERILGRLEDLDCTVTLVGNYPALAELDKEYEFDVEEELVNKASAVERSVTYDVVGRLQSRSLGSSSHDNSPRPVTHVFLVDAYTEKHSDAATPTYQIDTRTDPPVFKQNGNDIF